MNSSRNERNLQQVGQNKYQSHHNLLAPICPVAEAFLTNIVFINQLRVSVIEI